MADDQHDESARRLRELRTWRGKSLKTVAVGAVVAVMRVLPRDAATLLPGREFPQCRKCLC